MSNCSKLIVNIAPVKNIVYTILLCMIIVFDYRNITEFIFKDINPQNTCFVF